MILMHKINNDLLRFRTYFNTSGKSTKKSATQACARVADLFVFLSFLSVKLTVTTVTTVTDLAGEIELVDVFVCFTEVSIHFVESDILSVHPDAQERLTVTLFAPALPFVGQ